MRILSFALLITFISSFSGCEFASFDIDKATDSFYHKRLSTVYSPDKRKYFTISENGTDTSDAHTQVLLNFKYSASGIYTVPGINRKINAYWKSNSLIVIETFKTYKAHQKWPQVQSFDDIVKIEYIER